MLRQFLLIIVAFIVTDFAWIFLAASKLYKKHVPDLLVSETIIWPAIIFYIVYPLAILGLAIQPSNTPTLAAMRGALLGLAAYGTYALTCQALFKGWHWSLTFSDMLWGAFITGFVAFLAAYLLPTS